MTATRRARKPKNVPLDEPVTLNPIDHDTPHVPDLYETIGKAIKREALPNDGGLTPDGKARVRICGNLIWPPGRHLVGWQDIRQAWWEYLDAYIDSHIEANCDSLDTAASIGASLKAWVCMNVEGSQFQETVQRALQDAFALGYQFARDKYAPQPKEAA